MKKLLCIAGLLAAILFVNTADASIGSPMRHSVATVSVVRPVTLIPVVKPVCTTCGHRRFHGRHFGHRHFGHGYFHGRHFGHRRFGYRGFHGRRFACTRCGR